MNRENKILLGAASAVGIFYTAAFVNFYAFNNLGKIAETHPDIAKMAVKYGFEPRLTRPIHNIALEMLEKGNWEMAQFFVDNKGMPHEWYNLLGQEGVDNEKLIEFAKKNDVPPESVARATEIMRGLDLGEGPQ